MTPLEQARFFASVAPHLLTDDDLDELKRARIATLAKWCGIIGPALCAAAFIAMIWRIK